MDIMMEIALSGSKFHRRTNTCETRVMNIMFYFELELVFVHLQTPLRWVAKRDTTSEFGFPPNYFINVYELKVLVTYSYDKGS